MGRMPLLQNIFLAFLFIVGIKQCMKTMQKMGKNTKFLDWWINHSLCSFLKVSRVALVNLISIITATSLIIHLTICFFVFELLNYVVKIKSLLFFYRLSFGFITMSFFFRF